MRKKLLLSAAMLIAAISTASAADLRQPVYTKAPPPAPVLYNWTGFYVGLNAGGKWVTNSNDSITAGEQVHASPLAEDDFPTIVPIAVPPRSAVRDVSDEIPESEST